MKNHSSARKLIAICLAATGIGAAAQQRADAPTPRANRDVAPKQPADLIADFPRPAGNSATGQGVARAIEKARRNPDDGQVWVNLGDALMQRARESADQNVYGDAERAYQKALSLDPESAEAMTGLAWVFGGRHEFDKSIAWAKRAIALDSQNHAAYGLLGEADVELGNYEAALEDYQKMLDIRPDLSSYSRSAHLLYLMGDTRKGIWLMEKAVKAGGPYAENTAWCRAQLALMHFNNGALLPAEQVLQEALKQTPNNRHVLAAMGKVKAARKDYQAAISFHKKALAIAPDHNGFVALGDLYQLTGDKDQAEKEYARVEKLHERSHAGSGVPHSHLHLAQFYADHDRNLTEALRLALESKSSKNIFDADTLAWCYYKNGRYTEAREAIRRALRFNTPDAKILFHAGMIHARLGEHAAAQKYLHRALTLNPNFSPLDIPVAVQTLESLGQAVRRSDR